MPNKRLTVDIPEDSMEDLQLLKVLHDKPMREIIIEAIKMYINEPSRKNEMRDLRNRIYRLEYDSHTQ